MSDPKISTQAELRQRAEAAITKADYVELENVAVELASLIVRQHRGEQPSIVEQILNVDRGLKPLQAKAYHPIEDVFFVGDHLAKNQDYIQSAASCFLTGLTYTAPIAHQRTARGVKGLLDTADCLPTAEMRIEACRKAALHAERYSDLGQLAVAGILRHAQDLPTKAKTVEAYVQAARFARPNSPEEKQAVDAFVTEAETHLHGYDRVDAFYGAAFGAPKTGLLLTGACATGIIRNAHEEQRPYTRLKFLFNAADFADGNRITLREATKEMAKQAYVVSADCPTADLLQTSRDTLQQAVKKITEHAAEAGPENAIAAMFYAASREVDEPTQRKALDRMYDEIEHLSEPTDRRQALKDAHTFALYEKKPDSLLAVETAERLRQLEKAGPLPAPPKGHRPADLLRTYGWFWNGPPQAP